MAFLSCKCGWSQDDFWNKDGYNPFRQDIVDYWKKILLEQDEVSCERYVLDELNVPYEIRDGKYYADSRYFVAALLEEKAKSIRNMSVKTYQDWQKNKDIFVCPKCGDKNLKID